MRKIKQAFTHASSSKKINIQACAKFVPSLVIGWQIIKTLLNSLPNMIYSVIINHVRQGIHLEIMLGDFFKISFFDIYLT